MKGESNLFRCLIVSAVLLVSGCENATKTPYYNGYPPAVGKIIDTKCAVTGCHDAQGSGGSNGLDLTTWQSMFAGGIDGSVTIPYASGYSTMFIYTNTYPDVGISTPPSMPLYRSPLSHDEEVTLKSWIDNGAPDEDGFVKWSDNPARSKVYVCNQGCDNVTVFDEKTRLIMRYVDVGSGSQTGQAPHAMAVSPDGLYWYIIFYQNCPYLQKYSTATDKLVSQVNLGSGSWNTVVLSGDGTKAFCVNWTGNGSIAYVDLNSMQLKMTYQGPGLFTFPHGSVLTNNDSILYVTCNSGNFLYKIDVSNPMSPNILKSVVLDGSGTANVSTTAAQPHVDDITPDGKYLFCTLQASNQVAVVRLSDDSVIKHIPVGIFPQEISFSTNPATPYAFVTCMDDTVTFPGYEGSVAIINYNNYNVVKYVYPGCQPHGVAVDDNGKVVYIACRDLQGRVPPHHTTACQGNDGYVSFLNIATLTDDINKRIESSVDPYYIVVRH